MPECSHSLRYATADFVMSHAIDILASLRPDMLTLARAVLEHPAPWFTALRRVRDVIVQSFGLPTTEELCRQALNGSGAVVALFQVRS